MKRSRKTYIRLHGETYFGVDIEPGGRMVVAERMEGRPVRMAEFPSGDEGARSLREHIASEGAHPHVCIASCGALALGLAAALMHVPGIGVTLVAPKAVQAAADPEARAVHLARLAEKL
jgi:hypothetical protein